MLTNAEFELYKGTDPQLSRQVTSILFFTVSLCTLTYTLLFCRLRKRVRFSMPGTPLSELKKLTGNEQQNEFIEVADERGSLLH